jgi:hypothetical protein
VPLALCNVLPRCARIALCAACGLPAWFDAREYLSLNPDLEAAGLTPRRAIAHFVHHGHEERRDYSVVSVSGSSNGYGSCAVVVAIDRQDAERAAACAALLERSFGAVLRLVPEEEGVGRGGCVAARHFGSPIVMSAYAKIFNPRLIMIVGDDEG